MSGDHWDRLVLGVVVLGVLGLAVLSSMLKHNSGPSSSQPVYSTSYSPTYEPSETPSATGEPTVARPATTRPTATRPTAPRTTSTPKPKPGPTDADLVLRNRLYKAGGMGSVSCKESRSRPSSVSGARANYATLLSCLNKAWPELVTQSGGRFRSPHVQVFSGTITSPCGKQAHLWP